MMSIDIAHGDNIVVVMSMKSFSLKVSAMSTYEEN